MALESVSTARVILLGWTKPRDYEAGQIDGKPFQGGRYMRLCVGTDEHDFTVVKVKSAEVAQCWEVVQHCGRGVEVDLTYTLQTDRDGSSYRLRAIRLPVPAK